MKKSTKGAKKNSEVKNWILATLLLIGVVLAGVGVYAVVRYVRERREEQERIEWQGTLHSLDCPYSEDTSEQRRNACRLDAKPMIYLYPTEEMEVNVKLGHEDYITTSYPRYNEGWEVVAYPDGKLIDKNNGRELYGLYWEGIDNGVRLREDGFVVEGEKTAEFLEEKLRALGLSEREADEFIIYWLPKLEHNRYNYIRFETREEIEAFMPIEVSPRPDTEIRVMMDFLPLEEKIEVREQELKTVKREGFVMVEWGGSMIGEAVR